VSGEQRVERREEFKLGAPRAPLFRQDYRIYRITSTKTILSILSSCLKPHPRPAAFDSGRWTMDCRSFPIGCTLALSYSHETTKILVRGEERGVLAGDAPDPVFGQDYRIYRIPFFAPAILSIL
jgi:hypothetical protein